MYISSLSVGTRKIIVVFNVVNGATFDQSRITCAVNFCKRYYSLIIHFRIETSACWKSKHRKAKNTTYNQKNFLHL